MCTYKPSPILTILKSVASMQALDGLFRENEKEDKKQRLEKRKKKLSEMLVKETKEYEVNELTNYVDLKKLMMIDYYIVKNKYCFIPWLEHSVSSSDLHEMYIKIMLAAPPPPPLAEILVQ